MQQHAACNTQLNCGKVRLMPLVLCCFVTVRIAGLIRLLVKMDLGQRNSVGLTACCSTGRPLLLWCKPTL
jgi:hypothetical protein